MQSMTSMLGTSIFPIIPEVEFGIPGFIKQAGSGLCHASLPDSGGGGYSDGPNRKMSMQLMVSGQMQMAQIVEPKMGDSFYEAVSFWTQNPTSTAIFPLKDGPKEIDFTIAPDEWIHSIQPGENYGIYVGEMMFINRSLYENHPDWLPFVIAKLHGEQHVDAGLDKTGMQKHYDALFLSIRLAKNILDTPALTRFLEGLLIHERTGYFEWDEEASRFFEGGPSTLEAKRAYLEAHHGNKWVSHGRTEEAIAELSPFLTGGYGNHAQSIFNALVNHDMFSLYSAAIFVSALMEIPYDGEGQTLLIRPPFNAIAYALTKEFNGKADLIEFIESADLKVGDDLIRRNDKKRTTLVALSKRLSREISQIEMGTRVLMGQYKDQLDGALIPSEDLGAGVENRLPNPQSHQEMVERLEQKTANAAQKLEALQEASEMLQGLI